MPSKLEMMSCSVYVSIPSTTVIGAIVGGASIEGDISTVVVKSPWPKQYQDQGALLAMLVDGLDRQYDKR